MRRPSARLALILLALAPLSLAAQSLQPPASSVIRYHHGDNLAWAAPSFDDSSWPVAAHAAFPSPGYESDGYFWVRTRIALPLAAAAPLAVRISTADAFPNAQELWVNGTLVGRYGDFPPHPSPLIHPQMLVFDIPAGVAKPGSVAVIALRTWNAPDDWSESLLLRHPGPISVEFSVGSAPLLHALAAEAQDRAWLRFWPQFTLELVLILLGFAVLALGIWARNRTLLLCALWLVVLPVFLVFYPLFPLFVAVDSRIVYTAFLIVNAIGMCVVVEFTWSVQAFRDRIFRAALHLCWIGLTIAGLFSLNRMHPGAPVYAGMLAENWLLFTFNVIASGADLIALAGFGRNRPVAAAMLLISVAYFLGIAGHPLNFGWPGFSFFTVAFYVCTLFIAVLLLRQTWVAWYKAEDLRVEFAAAQEVQQRLVPDALPRINRVHLGAAYLPAAEVGGDFYQVFPQPDGAALIVIGDVSGKGLKAAMTGSVVLGALRSLSQENLPPAQILIRLNAQLAASSDGGFVTCLCARIAADGSITLANAGHLAPYRNGDEIPLDSSLPLGITADAAYAETTLQLAPGDTLTFISDGVVEAQNSAGELFGFERTRAISTQSAEEIARAAQAHGQQDDITVLTLEWSPAVVAAS